MVFSCAHSSSRKLLLAKLCEGDKHHPRGILSRSVWLLGQSFLLAFCCCRRAYFSLCVSVPKVSPLWSLRCKPAYLLWPSRLLVYSKIFTSVAFVNKPTSSKVPSFTPSRRQLPNNDICHHFLPISGTGSPEPVRGSVSSRLWFDDA